MRTFTGGARIVVLGIFVGACSGTVSTGSPAASSQVASPTPTVASVSPSATQIVSPSASSTSMPPSEGILGGDGWIAWQGDGLTLARLDGSERGPLFPSDPGRDAGHPDWSPDGSRLLFVSDHPDGTADIWVVDRDGSNDRVMVDCVSPCEFAEDPAWSPEGQRLAYWTTTDDGSQVIRVADAASGGVQSTIPAPKLVGPVTPRWSPDGRHLAVHAEVYEQNGADFNLVDGRIGVIDLEANSPAIEMITPEGMAAMYPDWSPDGSRILFLAGNLDPFFGDGTPTDLYTIRPDGTDLVRLTERAIGDAKLGTPTWTQAAPSIVMTLIEGGQFSLGALEADGSGLIELVGMDGATMEGAHPRVWVEP